MQPEQYIKPIDFSSMLSSAEKIQRIIDFLIWSVDALMEETRVSTSLTSTSCTVEALYNIIQEATENEVWIW